MTTLVEIGGIVRYFETLSPETVAALEQVYTPDAYFRDPFNEVRGVAPIRRVFEHMFEVLAEPRFVIVNRIVQADQAMVEWDFLFRIRRFRPREAWTVHGVSHLRLAGDGRIAYHRDYWDTGDELYAKLPGIGPVVRYLKRRMA